MDNIVGPEMLMSRWDTLYEAVKERKILKSIGEAAGATFIFSFPNVLRHHRLKSCIPGLLSTNLG
jgi:hypothetical protein